MIDLQKKAQITVSPAEHEIWLSFNTDQEAMVFEKWLIENWTNFVKYYGGYNEL